MLTIKDNVPLSGDIAPAYPTVRALQGRMRGQFLLLCTVVLGLTALGFALLARPGTVTYGIWAGVAAVGVIAWLWDNPTRGIYVLLAAAVVLESQTSYTVYADDIGRYIPFFEDLATWTHIAGLSASVAELFMVLVPLIWLVKTLATRRVRVEGGTLLWPLGLYTIMVVIGELHGLATGGDVRISGWEIRAQIYLFIAYILAANLIKTRRHIEIVAWILILGTGLKGLQGTWRLFVELGGSVDGVAEFFPHEQSYFFNAFITFTPILFLYHGPRSLKRIALALLPFVVIANLANGRRAAVVTLLVGIAGMVILTAIVYPRRRRLMIVVLLLLAVMLPPYYVTFQNSSGLLAQPARAIASAFNPQPRDASSNQYRDNEDKDILATVQANLMFGYGYGKPMLMPYPLPNIKRYYVFYNIMPHNSILWVWMRLGSIGYVLLWMLIGAAIIQAAALIRRLADPFLKGLSMLIVLLVIQQVVFAYLDLQWVNYRNLIFIGVLLAVIGRLTKLVPPEQPRYRVPMISLTFDRPGITGPWWLPMTTPGERKRRWTGR